MNGFNYLGLDETGPSTPSSWAATIQQAQQAAALQQRQAQSVQTPYSSTPAMNPFQLQPSTLRQDPQMARQWNATKYMVAGSAIGAVVGGAGLAALWTSHRVLGFLLGFIFVGPAAGAGVGYAIGNSKKT